jgi:predicted metal-dependent phosphoesterase TrpH
MRCDLHVHTIHSGMCTVPLLNRICRESYNDPREVYETLKQRGMDLVTVTDHDSIDAVECLRRHPDFFLSEEVSCRTSSGTLLHVGVYGIDERDHSQMQRRSGDFRSFLAYLRERRLLFSVNHMFSGLTGARTPADFAEFANAFPAVETRNGHMLPFANRYAQAWAASTGKIAVGGSDSHTMRCLGRTWTRVPGARDMEEFLEGLKSGGTLVEGESGNYGKLTRTVVDIGCGLLREYRWAMALAPLIAAIPAATLANTLWETWFAYRWGREVEAAQDAFLRRGSSWGSSSIEICSRSSASKT